MKIAKCKNCGHISQVSVAHEKAWQEKVTKGMLICPTCFDKDIEIIDKNSSLPTRPKKIGRNSPCPCGSGKKYKKCCLDR